MNIINKNLSDLVGAAYNPRKKLKPGDKEYEKLKRSIETWGYVDPIIWNKRTNTVVGGHQRLSVLKDLGFDSVEVVEVDLDVDNEKALNIALNKVSGEWDAEKLEDLLRELNNDTDLDVELTGFDLDEINTIFNGSDGDIEDTVEDKNTKKLIKQTKAELDEFCKEANDVLENPRDIRVGDKYKLGNHILLCGDSYKPETLDKLLGGEKCTMIFTDPPYNYKSIKHVDGKKIYKNTNLSSKILDGVKNDKLDRINIDDLEYLLDKQIKSIYICCNRHDIYKYIELAIKHKYKYDILVLFKQNVLPIHRGAYINDIEYVLYLRLAGCIFNNELSGIYYRHLEKEPTPDEVLEKQFYSHVYFRGQDLIQKKNDKNIKLEHPTVKPLRLIIPKIAISSNEGDIVVDMFSGSGSTLIACEKLNRRCYTVEIMPKYCNTTIDRWEAYTGEKAELIERDETPRYMNIGDTDG